MEKETTLLFLVYIVFWCISQLLYFTGFNSGYLPSYVDLNWSTVAIHCSPGLGLTSVAAEVCASHGFDHMLGWQLDARAARD